MVGQFIKLRRSWRCSILLNFSTHLKKKGRSRDGDNSPYRSVQAALPHTAPISYEALRNAADAPTALQHALIPLCVGDV
jgi:hypothetical protein